MAGALSEVNALIERESVFVERLSAELAKVIVGQRYLIDRLLIGVLTGGHLLLEGVPGLAKTLAVQSLAKSLDVKFKRIQFTPDLLPSDLIGTVIFNPKEATFNPKPGPIFTHFLLADEINRAPAKVQSALLEAMQERQVTLGDQTYRLEDPFLVLATQNPIEQEGTYALPEAQLDRFLMKLVVSYPSKDEEKQIIDRMTTLQKGQVTKIMGVKEILRAREVVNAIYVDDKIKEYVLSLVFATREPEAYNLKSLEPMIEYGASPRASIALIQAAKAHAFLQRRGYVTPDDVKAIGKDVLRHRIIPSFAAEAEEITADKLITRIFDEVEVP